MEIVSDHGFPRGDGSLPTDDPFDRFKNERDYIAQSGRMKITVAAMDWAAAEIERLRLAANQPDPDAMNEQRADEDSRLIARVRERIIQTCANIASRHRPNLTARDIEQEIRALTPGEPKR